MRRKRHSTPSNGGLLLDTLSNALGSVLFIALLVVILSKNAPVLTDAIGETFAPPVATLEALSQLPTTAQLEGRLAAVHGSLAAYKQSGLSPSPTTQSMSQLMAQRHELQNKPTPTPTPKPTPIVKPPENSRVIDSASLHGAAVMVLNNLTHVVIFKDGKIFLSDGKLLNSYPNMPKAEISGGVTLVRDIKQQVALSATVKPTQSTEYSTALQQLSQKVTRNSRVFYAIHPSGYDLYAQVQDQLPTAGESQLIPLPESADLEYSLGWGAGFGN